MRSGCDRELLIKAFREVPFIVTFAVNFDEVTMMSDIVFPEHHFLEQEYARFYIVSHQNIDDSIRGLKCVIGRNQATKPLYNTRLADDVLLEIAGRASFLKGENGINDYINQSFMLKGNNKLDLNKSYNIAEIIDKRVKQVYGDEYSFDKLLEEGAIYRFDTRGKYGYNYFYWPGNKTKHPIYFERLLKSGAKMRENLAQHQIKLPAWSDQEGYLQFYQAVPQWITPPEMTAPLEYDMYVCNWKTPLMRHGTGNTQENAWLAEIRDSDPYELYIWMNTATAVEKGLKDGDEVCIESQFGKVMGKLKVTQLIHPEVLGVPGCYGSGTYMMSPDSRKGTHYNLLLSGEEETCIDPISGSITISPKVKIYKPEIRGRKK